MKILVINAGSSSVKYQLFDMFNESVLAKGKIERIGMDTAILTHEREGYADVREVSEILEHTSAIRKILAILVHPKYGVVQSVKEIGAVGHRVVHGGESFKGSVIVNESVKLEIKRLFDLAPLHNPAHMLGISAVEVNMPGVPQVVAFDTAFHQTMPATSYLYPIPTLLYRKHKIRRYGFHGTSHKYVSERAALFIGKPIEQLKMITCHIGNGASCTAIQGGKSIDTSMGMTPLEGLMMGTRSGDLDPAIVPFAMAKEDLTLNEVNSMLNKHSGLQAISGLSSDVREITEAMAEGDKHAQLAFDMYTYRIRKYIGAYAAALNGLDALIFTAGVGENSEILRQSVCEGLTFLGIDMDPELNRLNRGLERRIGSSDSKVEILVIPTNEEWVIAMDTFALVAEDA
ncbi:Acetate kinase [compost metagenome]